MSGSKYQHKLILQTLLFLFLISTIGKISKLAVNNSKVNQVMVNDDDTGQIKNLLEFIEGRVLLSGAIPLALLGRC